MSGSNRGVPNYPDSISPFNRSSNNGPSGSGARPSDSSQRSSGSGFPLMGGTSTPRPSTGKTPPGGTHSNRRSPGSAPNSGSHDPNRGFQTPSRPPFSPITPSFSPLSSPPAPQATLTYRPIKRDPVNRPFRCHHAYTPTAALANLPPGQKYIAIQPGDIGCVKKWSNQDPLHDIIHVTVPRRGIHGWIPYDTVRFIDIKFRAIWGQFTENITFRVSFDVQLSTDFLVEMFTDLYPRTIYALLTAIGEAREIDLSGMWTDKASDQNYRLDLTKVIVEGARRRGALEVLNKPDFSLRQSRADKGAGGGYMQVLPNFQGEPDRLPEIRFGKAVNLYDRDRGHNQDWRTSEAPFYVASREADPLPEPGQNEENRATVGNRLLYPLHDGLNDDSQRSFAEQLNILQFGAYRPWLLNKQLEERTLTPAQASQHVTEVSATAGDKRDAQALMGIARDAFRESGWTVATRRPNFGCVKGWNQTSPLFENNLEQTPWTRTDTISNGRKVKATFRRNAKEWQQGMATIMGIKSSASVRSSRQLHWQVYSPHPTKSTPDFIRTFPSAGTKYYIVVETMLNGEPHVDGYGRLRKLGFWSDRNDASGVAIYIKWYDDVANFWKSKPLHHSLPLELRSGAAGSNAAYTVCMAIRRFFLRQNAPNFPGDWEVDFIKAARVIHITADEYEPAVIATNISAVTQAPRPYPLSEDSLIQALENAGADMINKWPVSKSKHFETALSKHFGTVRAKCDYCNLFGNLNRFYGGCVRFGATHKCTRAANDGVPTSWTKGADKNHPIAQLFMPQDKGPTRRINDSALRKLGG